MGEHPPRPTDPTASERTFTVVGTGCVLDAFVANFISARYPGATVRTETSSTVARGSVQVNADGGRWLLLVEDTDAPWALFAEALNAGANGVAGLTGSTESFERALRAILTGEEICVPDHVMRWMAASSIASTTADRDEEAKLTRREREVLRLVERGLTNTEIAAELQISTNTVRTHLHALSVKLDVNSRARLIARSRLEGTDSSPTGSR